jgi:hypothetical protein
MEVIDELEKSRIPSFKMWFPAIMVLLKEIQPENMESKMDRMGYCISTV